MFFKFLLLIFLILFLFIGCTNQEPYISKDFIELENYIKEGTINKSDSRGVSVLNYSVKSDSNLDITKYLIETRLVI